MSALLGLADKRVTSRTGADKRSRGLVGAAIFTCNAGGTTATAVGANAAPATETNVVRLGDLFKLFTAAGVLKEEKTFKVTGVAVAASTTVTFSPVAAVATANGDVLRQVTSDDFIDEETMDTRLTALDATTFTAARLRTMNTNDKMYAIRQRSDPGSL